MTRDFYAGEKSGEYYTKGAVTSEAILAMARQLIKNKLAKGEIIDNPRVAMDYLPHHLALLEHETFWVLFLTNQHKVLAFEQLFSGTIDQSAVYPREVIKRVLQLNAKAVIFAHNHPSGNSEPSSNDIYITRKLKETLALIDVNVLDHFIVGADVVTSLAEQGYC